MRCVPLTILGPFQENNLLDEVMKLFYGTMQPSESFGRMPQISHNEPIFTSIFSCSRSRKANRHESHRAWNIKAHFKYLNN